MENSTNEKRLNRTALSATLHCLTGCAIGEILGMVIGATLGFGNWTTVALSVALAFVFGYSFTLMPLLRAGIAFGTSAQLAFASDTISIIVMEIIDNAIMLVIPGAMEAGPATPLFWGSMALALGLAALAAFPVVRWLIARGRGHAVVHRHHGHHVSSVQKENQASGKKLSLRNGITTNAGNE